VVRLDVHAKDFDSLTDISSEDLARDITALGERVSTVLVLGDLAFVVLTLGNRTLADKVIFRAAK